MNNHPELTYPDLLLPRQFSSSPTTVAKVLTTLALLLLGYYGLTFFDAWPSTIQRFSYETCIYLIPSQLIYAMQQLMIRTGRLAGESAFRRSDFGNRQAKEDALRRMVGASVVPGLIRRARSLSGLDNFVPESKETQPPGLGNWDNSCYQNSVLQGLASLPAFDDYIERSLALCNRTGLVAETHDALASFIEQLNALSYRRTTLWTPSILKSMDSWQQQDAQEYFSRVLEAIEKEAMKYSRFLRRRSDSGLECIFKRKELRSIDKENKSVDDSHIQRKPTEIRSTEASNRAILESQYRNPMDGMLAQSLRCKTCGFSEGISLTQFNCLTVNMGLRGDSSVEDLLDEYTAPEDVDGVECTNCTKIATETQKEKVEDGKFGDENDSSTKPRTKPVLRIKAKQITVGRLPVDLVIHINRSIFDDYGNQRKNTSLVHFPEQLKFQKRWCAPLDLGDDCPSVSYELKCIVTHYGRHENGHYVAFGLRGKNWYCFNDEVVTLLSLEEVLSRGNAFMLFYEVMDSKEIPPLQDDIAPVVTTEISDDMSSTQSTSSEIEDSTDALGRLNEPPIPILRAISGHHGVVDHGPLTPSRIVPAL